MKNLYNLTLTRICVMSIKNAAVRQNNRSLVVI